MHDQAAGQVLWGEEIVKWWKLTCRKFVGKWKQQDWQRVSWTAISYQRPQPLPEELWSYMMGLWNCPELGQQRWASVSSQRAVITCDIGQVICFKWGQSWRGTQLRVDCQHFQSWEMSTSALDRGILVYVQKLFQNVISRACWIWWFCKI